MEQHPFVCPASKCTYGFTVTTAYVSDSNQIMVACLSVYGDSSPILYNLITNNWEIIHHYLYISSKSLEPDVYQILKREYEKLSAEEDEEIS